MTTQKRTPPAGAPLRAGIVGAGLMGRWHADALRRAGGRLVGIADVDRDAALRLAGGTGGPLVYESMDDMLAGVRPDVVHVCTPSSTHVELVERALDASAHVLVEKPLASTLADVERLLELAASRSMLLCPVHQFPFQAGAVAASRALGRIGRPVYLAGVFHTAGGDGADQATRNRLAGEILPHPLSLMWRFVGAPLAESPWKVSSTGVGELRVLGEAGDVSLSIIVSLRARPTVASFLIAGTEGTIHLDLFHGFMLVEPGDVGRARKVLRPFDLGVRLLTVSALNLACRLVRWEPAYPGLGTLVRSFYDAVRGNAGPPISHEETTVTAAVRDRILAGAGLGSAENEARLV